MRIKSLIVATCAAALASCNGGGGNLPPAGGSGALSQSARARGPLPAAAKETVIYRFQGNAGSDGASPWAGLLHTNGAFYGTTFYGGAPGGGDGLVFEISSSGAESVVYRFQGGADGALPEGGLIAGPNGTLYGDTRYGGGACNGYLSDGCGTVFELVPNGSGYTEHIIYAFKGGQDGVFPAASLVLGKNGVLYGATVQGGGSADCPSGSGPTGCGTVFELKPKGSGFAEKVLHRFQAGADGAIPTSVALYDNVLYGATNFGGTGTNCTYGSCGTIYSVTTSGKEKVLYSFQGGTSDGSYPESVVPVKGGTFYGVTTYGGASNKGTAFEFAISGSKPTERVIHSFPATKSDGYYPWDFNGLVSDSQGNLYGTTGAGGGSKCHCGTAFELSPSGSSFSEAILHSFKGGTTDGYLPFASLIFDSTGNLWGTTLYGGSKNCSTASGVIGCGIVYKITP